jgi:HAD superfamily hydrolase (TIGR01509 family)
MGRAPTTPVSGIAWARSISIRPSVDAARGAESTLTNRAGELAPQVDAVIFDMDGLIFDTERLIRCAVQEAARSLGFEISDAFFGTMIGVPGPECRELIRRRLGPSFPLSEYLAAFRSESSRLLSRGIPIKPGAAELLGHLRDMRMPLGLATSSGREEAERHLRHSDLRRYFDVVVTRNDVRRGKPHPDPFLKAADQLGVAPCRCLVLEDSHHGIRAAAAAGCVPVMVPDLLDATDEMRALCFAVVSDLNEVRRSLFGSMHSAHRA